LPLCVYFQDSSFCAILKMSKKKIITENNNGLLNATVKMNLECEVPHMENMNANQTELSSVLPMMALSDIPESKPDAKEIVALVKDSGKVTGYQLSDGQVLNKEEGVEAARQGEIKGVGIATRKGNEYLKSLPDGKEENNLSNLPSITDEKLS
jgi:hypothetical protein